MAAVCHTVAGVADKEHAGPTQASAIPVLLRGQPAPIKHQQHEKASTPPPWASVSANCLQSEADQDI